MQPFASLLAQFVFECFEIPQFVKSYFLLLCFHCLFDCAWSRFLLLGFLHILVVLFLRDSFFLFVGILILNFSWFRLFNPQWIQSEFFVVKSLKFLQSFAFTIMLLFSDGSSHLGSVPLVELAKHEVSELDLLQLVWVLDAEVEFGLLLYEVLVEPEPAVGHDKLELDKLPVHFYLLVHALPADGDVYILLDQFLGHLVAGVVASGPLEGLGILVSKH